VRSRTHIHSLTHPYQGSSYSSRDKSPAAVGFSAKRSDRRSHAADARQRKRMDESAQCVVARAQNGRGRRLGQAAGRGGQQVEGGGRGRGRGHKRRQQANLLHLCEQRKVANQLRWRNLSSARIKLSDAAARRP